MYKTMTTDYSYLYNQIFLIFINPKITCQLAVTNDWELLIEGSKWAQIFRKHVKVNLVPWKIAAGHRPSSTFHNKKNAAGGVKLPHPIWNRVRSSSPDSISLKIFGSSVLIFSVFIKIASILYLLVYETVATYWFFFLFFFEWYKEYSSCLSSFSSFSELLSDFNCAKEIVNLLSIWFSVVSCGFGHICWRNP